MKEGGKREEKHTIACLPKKLKISEFFNEFLVEQQLL
jgi:hypothetical protein